MFRGGSLISLDGVAPIRMVGVSASVIFPCTIKSKRFLVASTHPSSPGKRAVAHRLTDVCFAAIATFVNTMLSVHFYFINAMVI